MRCSLCGSKLTPLITDLPFKVSDTSIVILKGLPVLQCDNCREYLLDDLVMNRVEEILQRADAAAASMMLMPFESPGLPRFRPAAECSWIRWSGADKSGKLQNNR